ncbi:MAG: class I SAM-dependent methyltransferase [Saprospiraceae bacterium]|nr:class I SAM-dependent methyltransferase [Saprospiraceae bacterium]
MISGRLFVIFFLKKYFVFIFLVSLFFVFGCKEQSTYLPDEKNISTKDIQKDTIPSSFNDVDRMQYNIGRTIWQKPDVVINQMGDLSEKTIADIGAGTGYFSFRMGIKAKKVIAIDINKDVLDTIKQFIPLLPEKYRHKIETRLAKTDDPMLEPEEVDLIVIINTVTYIPDLDNYLQTLRKGLKKGGEIMIVDYKMKRLPINAPPRTQRMYLDVLEDKLEKNGFTLDYSDDTSLDYQFILKAINK